jgi:hypothetical protein
MLALSKAKTLTGSGSMANTMKYEGAIAALGDILSQLNSITKGSKED